MQQLWLSTDPRIKLFSASQHKSKPAGGERPVTYPSAWAACLFIRRAWDNNWASTLLTAAVQTLCHAAAAAAAAASARHMSAWKYWRATCMHATFTGRRFHSVGHSQNTTMLSYAKRCCFPNTPSEPRERACLPSQGAWTGSLCQSAPPLCGSVIHPQAGRR